MLEKIYGAILFIVVDVSFQHPITRYLVEGLLVLNSKSTLPSLEGGGEAQHDTIVGKYLLESMHKHLDVSHYYVGIHHS